MGLAFWVASFSKDPNTQMGAIIVSSNNYPLGYGYNGPPRGMDDDSVDWSRPNKYDYIIHAEANAIDHSLGALEDSTLYVTGKPCKSCMLRIATTGIEKVIYFPYYSHDKASMFAESETNDKTDEIAKAAGVRLEAYDGNLNWMRDHIKSLVKQGVFE
jgi:dCMP deaminase